MENYDWRERFEYIFTVEENPGEKYLRRYDYRTIVEELEHFIEREIEKAEERGRKEIVEKIRKDLGGGFTLNFFEGKKVKQGKTEVQKWLEDLTLKEDK